jgi:L-2-amino-thiazoline-4-carboxylic acid hydrolase
MYDQQRPDPTRPGPDAGPEPGRDQPDQPWSGYDEADQYVDDPEAAAEAVVEAFFAAAVREAAVRLGADPGTLDHDLRRLHAELVAAHQQWVVDEPARHNVRMTLAVLAGYRLLAPRLPDDDLLPLLRSALVDPLGEAVRSGTAVALDASPDPFALLVEVSKQREVHSFGAGFTFARPRDDRDEYLVDVRRCFYHELLVANGAGLLTPVLCAWDANWIDTIDPERHGVRFERATTIGLGGASCPFHFRRTGPDGAAGGTTAAE